MAREIWPRQSDEERSSAADCDGPATTDVLPPHISIPACDARKRVSTKPLRGQIGVRHASAHGLGDARERSPLPGQKRPLQIGDFCPHRTVVRWTGSPEPRTTCCALGTESGRRIRTAWTGDPEGQLARTEWTSPRRRQTGPAKPSRPAPTATARRSRCDPRAFARSKSSAYPTGVRRPRSRPRQEASGPRPLCRFLHGAPRRRIGTTRVNARPFRQR